MKNCLNCGKELTQTPGKKEKKYCDAKCKQQHWHKLKADKKDIVKLSREDYEALIARAEPKLDFNTKPITKKVLVTKKASGKPIVKELDKEGSKPYKPKSQDQNLTYLEKRQKQKLK